MSSAKGKTSFTFGSHFRGSHGVMTEVSGGRCAYPAIPTARCAPQPVRRPVSIKKITPT